MKTPSANEAVSLMKSLLAANEETDEEMPAAFQLKLAFSANEVQKKRAVFIENPKDFQPPFLHFFIALH